MTPEDKEWFRSYLAEGIHTAFRKASDHPNASKIHALINELPTSEWNMIILTISEAMIDGLEHREKPIRIRCTDQLGNIAYIIKDGRRVTCVLSNGIPASLTFAVGHIKDEMGLKFNIADARTPEEALRVVRDTAGHVYRVELV